MPVPSVKGSLYQTVVNDLLDALQAGRTDRAALEAALKPEDLERLDGEIAVASWYAVDSYARLLRALCQVEAGGRAGWYEQSGRQAAERLVALGIYAQLDDHTAGAWEGRVGRSLLSIAPALFNFGRWSWSGIADDQGFTIWVDESADMPEEVARRSHGFVSFMVERAAGDALRVKVDYRRAGNRIEFPVRVHRPL
jgi:hypothetical protein